MAHDVPGTLAPHINFDSSPVLFEPSTAEKLVDYVCPSTTSTDSSVVFLLHIAVEAPFALQGIWAGHSLPFIQLTNTTLVLLKLYSALLLASCLASLLCFNLPEFLPGKRAFAIQLLIYHSIAATILFQSPRFIPHSLGSVAESVALTPEKIWGALHGVVSVIIGMWWQSTLGYAKSIKQT